MDRDKWGALVNMIINFWFPRKVGNFSITSGTVSFSEGLCSMEQVNGKNLNFLLFLESMVHANYFHLILSGINLGQNTCMILTQ